MPSVPLRQLRGAHVQAHWVLKAGIISPGTPALRSLRQRVIKQEALGNGDNRAIYIHQYSRHQPKRPDGRLYWKRRNNLTYPTLPRPLTFL